jgi:hypothetical protein
MTAVIRHARRSLGWAVGLPIALAACGRIGFDPASAVTDATTGGEAMIDATAATPIAFIQCAGMVTQDGSTPPLAFHVPVRGGDLLLLAYDFENASASPNQPTDSLGTSYSVISGVEQNLIAYGIAPSSGADTASAPLTATAGAYYELRVCEFSGIAGTDPYDTGAAGSGVGSGVDAVVSPPFTTSSPNELIFSFENGMPTASPGTGYTEASNFDSDESEYAVASTPGTYESRTTLASDGAWDVLVATFRGK